MSDYDFSEAVQGQFEGAIRRFDAADALTDEEVETFAANAADMFESSALSRLSNERIEALASDGTDGEDDE